MGSFLWLALLMALIGPSRLSARQAPSPDEGLEEPRRLVAAGRTEAAGAAYRRHLAQDPACFDGHTEFGQLLASQQKLDEARVHLVAAVQLRPDVATSHIRLSQLLLMMEDLSAAEMALREAARIDPAEPSVRFNLGRIYEVQRRDEDAAQEYMRFLELAPEDHRANTVRIKLALYHDNKQQLDLALEYFGQVLARDRTRPGVYDAIAGIHYRRGNYDEALPAFLEVIRLDPSSDSAHANVGFIYRMKGHLEEAVAHYTRAVEIDPSNATNLFRLGTLHADLLQDEQAMAFFERVIALQPEHPLAHYSIGKLYAKRGDRSAAQREFDLHRRIQAEESRKQRTASTMEGP